MKKLLCKWGLHSFKHLVTTNPETLMPIASCQWCGKDCISMYGVPPMSFEVQRLELLGLKKDITPPNQ